MSVKQREEIYRGRPIYARKKLKFTLSLEPSIFSEVRISMAFQQSSSSDMTMTPEPYKTVARWGRNVVTSVSVCAVSVESLAAAGTGRGAPLYSRPCLAILLGEGDWRGGAGLGASIVYLLACTCTR